MFDQIGRAVGGPTPVGLDRVATRVRGDTVSIDLGTVIHDPRPRGSVGREISGPFCENRITVGGGSGPVTLPLESIPAGVSHGQIGSARNFVVRDGQRVAVFIVDAQHLEGERPCGGARTSVSSFHRRTPRNSTGTAMSWEVRRSVGSTSSERASTARW